ncbi:MAG: ABC transporter substrate-binding protein [Bacillota bacterium]
MVKHAKNFLVVIGIVLMALVLLTGNSNAEEKLKIGISQIVEHKALDSAREGFIAAFEEKGLIEKENIEFIKENAQGEFSTAQSIAKKFKNEKVDMVLAIATPTAQAAANEIDDIPVMITAVTDPESAGLVDSMEKPGGNVTGTSDLNPVEEQFELITKIMPDVNSVGVLYNSGEVNSEVQVEIAKDVAKELDIELKEGTVSNSSEVQLAASSLVDKVDAIYIPTDNVIASALPSVLKVTDEKGIPVFASEGAMVEEGAVATKGINYYELGKKTGNMAIKVLNGEDTAEMEVETSEDLDLIINESASKKLDLKIPEELLKNADEVIE